MSTKLLIFLERYVGTFLITILGIYNRVFNLFSSSSRHTTQKLLFIKFIEQGALVLHYSAFKEAEVKYGRENIYICTFTESREIVKLLGIFKDENIITLNISSAFSFLADFVKSVNKIRRAGIDTTIDLEFLSKFPKIYAYLSGAKTRVGYQPYDGNNDVVGRLLTHKLNYSPYNHVKSSSLALLRALELPAGSLPAFPSGSFNELSHQLQLSFSGNDIVHVKQKFHFLNTDRKIIVINPGFNDLLPLRKWPEDYYRQLVQKFLAGTDCLVVITGRDDEKAKAEAFVNGFNNERVVNIAGQTTLYELLCIYSVSHLLIVSDSGAGHFATMTPIRSIVLFGPETPALYGPIGKNVNLVYKGLYCSPCFNVYNNRISPCANNVCMKEILPNEVFQLANNIIDNL